MKLSCLGEFGIIERVRRSTVNGRGVNLGIGDDAAWVQTPSGSCLVTSDVLLEGVHFDLRWTSLYALGYKTLAVNMSDIAAMGGTPAYLILSLGIPKSLESNHLDELYRGIRSLATKSGVTLVGGDTSIAQCLLISACLMGHPNSRPITRHGARAGDDIYVTGTLGDSALALKLLKRKSPKLNHRSGKYLLSRHHFPTARVHTGFVLAKKQLARAMIDISDGLLQDLGHICKASRVGAVLLEEHLPLSQAYRSIAGRDGTEHALTGGEDYELLFCVRPRDRTKLSRIQKLFDVPITRIGKCVDARDGISVLNRHGHRLSFSTGGHDHFQSS